MNKLTFQISNLKFDIRFMDLLDQVPLFIFLHGFKSFRNWGFIPYICENLAYNGIITLNLDFSSNGVISENPILYDTDTFANNTISKEVQDVDLLLSILLNDSKENRALGQSLKNWNGQIYLCGHSRGAGIAIIAADKYREIQKVVLLSAISDFNRYTPRLINKWIEGGFLEFNDPQSNQKLRMNSTYILDLIENQEKYNLKKIMQRLDKPTILITAENDLTTPIRESNELIENYKKNQNNKKNHCNFVLIKKANHLFNCTHPFNGTNAYLDEVLQNVKEFLLYEKI